MPEKYIAIYKRDTILLSLSIIENNYYGNMVTSGSGGVKERGEIRGEVRGDTLIGDYLYIPHRHKFEKRKALVLKRQGNILLKGSGKEYIYMGIPFYDPNSIQFDSVKFVFHHIK